MILASTIAKWVIVAVFAVNTLVVVDAVGKPRGPLQPSTAAWTVAFNAVYATAIILLWSTG